MSSDYRSEPELELPDEGSSLELESQVQKAKQELEDLKRRQEQIEREKQRLEELSRRQDELEKGCDEMVDKFTRALVVAQKETEETHKRLEQLKAIQNSFTQHLRTLESINPRSWSPQDLQKELSKALSEVDAAKAEFSRGQAKLLVEVQDEAAAAAAMSSDDVEYVTESERDFLYWLKAGLAFTLPLLVLGVIALAIFALKSFPGN